MVGMRPRGTAKQLEERRRRAIQLLNEGMSPSEVARAVKSSTSSVWRWRDAYRAKGWRGLRPRPIPGRPSKLSSSQKEKLIEVLTRGPAAAGYRTELWTLERVAQVIQRRFGVDYDPSAVWHILRKLGWSSQKPERQARERNEEEVQRWREVDWPRIKKRSAARP
jgi:transposase